MRLISKNLKSSFNSRYIRHSSCRWMLGNRKFVDRSNSRARQISQTLRMMTVPTHKWAPEWDSKAVPSPILVVGIHCTVQRQHCKATTLPSKLNTIPRQAMQAPLKQRPESTKPTLATQQLQISHKHSPCTEAPPKCHLQWACELRVSRASHQCITQLPPASTLDSQAHRLLLRPRPAACPWRMQRGT